MTAQMPPTPPAANDRSCAAAPLAFSTTISLTSSLGVRSEVEVGIESLTDSTTEGGMVVDVWEAVISWAERVILAVSLEGCDYIMAVKTVFEDFNRFLS